MWLREVEGMLVAIQRVMMMSRGLVVLQLVMNKSIISTVVEETYISYWNFGSS